MANQPFYHLRPNKCIDRKLFGQTLLGLSRLYKISEYCYTGFGSYLFDDFKLFHETLNVKKMISLEKDVIEFQRADFNRPYNCIELKNVSSTEYLSDLLLDDEENNIFWLDFVSPGELGTQLADYASLLNLLNPHDIVRITVNANPDSLGKNTDPNKVQSMRLEKLKNTVPEKYLPHDLAEGDVTRPKYPLTLLKIIKAVTLECLEDRPPFCPNFLFPLFSTVYADGQQMLTFTGIILNSHYEEDQIRDVLSEYAHNNFSWDQPAYIEIPALSVREIAEINKLLPSDDAQQQLMKQYPFIFSLKDERSAESYVAYYKHYPNYHQISF